MFTREELMGKSLEELKTIVRNFDMRVTKADVDLMDAVMTIKKAKAPAPRAVGSHRFVDTDLIAKGKMTEVEAQRIVDQKVAETQLKYASAVEELDPEEEIEIEDDEEVARFCEFCTSKGFRHLKSCTREVVNT